MKRALFLSLLGVGSVFLSWEAQGALTGLNVNLPTGPYAADFNMNSLTTTYTFSGGIGKFDIKNVGGPAAQTEQYTTGGQNPGTGNTYTSPTQFQGFFSMTAYVMQVAGQWQVISDASHISSFSITGGLLGSGTGDLLLTGNLKTGAGSFGWGAKTDNEFDFLFGVIAGGTDNQAILADFFGSGAGSGAMKFHEGTGTTYNGNLATTWFSSGGGSVDAFVPEPAFYSSAAACMAILGLGLKVRKSGRMNCLAA